MVEYYYWKSKLEIKTKNGNFNIGNGKLQMENRDFEN